MSRSVSGEREPGQDRHAPLQRRCRGLTRKGRIMPTTAREAYEEGKRDRAARPDATTWGGVLPFSVEPLTWAWLDGWYGRNRPVGVFCDHCWGYPLTDLPDGIMRCRNWPCRERNYPPVDKSRVDGYLATRDAGAGI